NDRWSPNTPSWPWQSPWELTLLRMKRERRLAHVPEKWVPVFRKGHAPINESGAHPDSTRSGCAPEHVLRRWKRPASGLAEEIVAKQIVEAALPRIVAVAADIDAPDELHLSGFRVLHVDIDVEDEVAHLLHDAPGRPIRAGLAREVALAAIAVADRGTG